ncbi:hypothetical protein MAM1_0078d04445 [Mucor ambiguus]|uniref:LysM domain-containing protein n=1 Tax=Mucor ambiguus TaxID=91626 RepID=A0A0C9MNY0_9FUNG|nr:hypothetical protein MAM1_0078d04445 [Mucor ambiguus]
MKFTLATLAVAAATVSAAVPNCVQKYTAKEGDNCRSVAGEHKVSLQQLYRWNFITNDSPAGDCSAFQAGETYCVKVDNRLRKRNWFYKTQGLTGQKLDLAKQKIAAAKAKKSTKKTTKKTSKKTTKKSTKKTTKKSTKKTTTKKPSTTKKTQSKPGDDWSSTPANAPSNAVRHIISTCTKYSTVTSKDSWCGDFSKRNGISMTQLYSWNAGLHGPGKHECDNLDDGKAYCVKA